MTTKTMLITAAPFKLTPAMLVSLRTKITGGIHYQRTELNAKREHETDIATWKTECTIDDVNEWDRAKTARQTAGGLIRRVCVHTNFGLLCPEAKYDDLDKAIVDARSERW